VKPARELSELALNPRRLFTIMPEAQP